MTEVVRGSIGGFVVHEEGDTARVVRRRRRMYAVTSTFLALVIGSAVIDGVGLVDVMGVDSAWTRSSGAGYDLSVRYGTVSRPALATPFDIEVVRAGGFDEPVTVAVTSSYLGMWDENGLSPTPSAETSAGAWTLWEFDPPEGERLSVSFDARIEPSVQSGRSGAVAVFVDGAPVVRVEFHTRVMP